ncbi:hypothetical protein HIM_06227 [Hirsutella minnesotensis 3608]|uniref:Uncharacterized protein n=1 Tax=Hirsutella minnesotensis 3608 TaxID=1043627 RepID=A0A0F7ZZL2_9HYPO|nr:hypothetical protein HIM_06227 [Hirsutella minnesotensis 3608]
MGYFFHRLLGQCVGAQSGQTWKQIRLLFDPIYTPAAVADLMPAFQLEIRQWLKRLAERGAGAASFTADVSGLCAELPLKMVALTLYGDALDQEARRASSRGILGQGLTRSWPGVGRAHGTDTGPRAAMLADTRSSTKAWPPRSTGSCPQERTGSWNGTRAISEDSILEWRRRAKSGLHNYGTGNFQVWRSMDGNSLRHGQFLHTIDEILFENLDVASAAGSFLLPNRAADATTQDRLRQETAQLVSAGDKQLRAVPRQPNTYLSHYCVESRRLYPNVCVSRLVEAARLRASLALMA